ncbi:MAG: hypothetical protein IJ735_07440 [Clostridia bacterium]|nr:hypothetical protein [Clostridia bacterium]
MDEKTMEKMAREYKAALATATDGTTVDRIIILEEEQLDCLDDLLYRSAGRSGLNRAASYLKTLTFRTLTLLSALKGETYLPSVRNRCPVQNAISRLKSLQVDIFVLLDELGMDYSTVAELLMLENRKAALIAAL